ncbi:hypothetical protein WJX75_006969 [Coccomyxa subellipsoidea]|uniref:cysteine--tRNA ligase n=1 Tax=Coccomyxa subellipsoidea TaxID=248742 RepID=A0ABR2YJY1_9CHLO
MLRKSVCIQEMPAETPAGLAYRLRERGNQVSQSMCWEVTGKSKTKENVEPTAYLNPIDVEYRLQACEDTQAVMAEDLENLRGFGSDLSTWRNQMEEASSQVATVLNLVESDTSDFRSHLSALQEEVATVKRQQPSLSALPEGPPLLRLDQIIEELEILSTRQTQSDKTFQATAHDLTFCLQRLEAGMEEMKVSLACQADSIASLQFQNEEHHTARMEQNARMACLEDTLQQLQARDNRAALQQGVLRLYNTLTKRKEDFMPLDPAGHLVTWYTCGPTVYDAAHLGHARYYITMDILRRVMEDYFGYSIDYVMNVTDVDDKIIRRARLNHLLQNFLDQTPDTAKVLQDARAGQRQKDSNERLSIEQTKLKKIEDNVKTLQQITASQSGVENGNALEPSGASYRDQIVQAAGDALAEDLDEQHGDQVTDHEVFRSHAARYEREFMEDLTLLNCRLPDVMTRVSEYMDEIKAYVQQIYENGMAYAVNGSVYFDTQAYREKGHTYGKLAPQAINSAAAADGEANFASVEKRNRSDFALWKQAKAGEPAWDSPECAKDEHGNLGKGRPGWHIECSAMASSLFDSRIDIHTGGIDLAFPHHENELAQAEAFFHEEYAKCKCEPQWVNYFLHAGHLNIDNMKMSKSLKNFISIRRALQNFSPRVLRIMFALAPWDKPMTFKEEKSALEARQKEKIFENFFLEVQAVLHKFGSGGSEGRLPTRWEAEERELNKAHRETSAKVHAALLDSIDVSTAMNALLELVSKANIYIKAREQQYAATPRGPPPQAQLVHKVALYITRILSIFGIYGQDEIGPGREPGAAAAAGGSREGAEPLLGVIADFRTTVRNAAKLGQSDAGKARAEHNNILKACDGLRNETLPQLGVQLEDRPDGTSICKFMSAAEQQAEAREAELALAAKELQKHREKLEKEVKRLRAEDINMASLKTRWTKYTSLGQPAADGAASEKQLKELRSEAKEVWKVLRKLKVTQSDLSLGQQELDMVQSVISGGTPVHEKLAGDVAARWKAYQSVGAAEAGKDSKAESDLADALYKALPDAANARLGSLVDPLLRNQAAIQDDFARAIAELQTLTKADIPAS